MENTTKAWVGFSASTGATVENHKILNWHFINYWQGSSRIEYTPCCTFTGNDTFDYWVKDPQGNIRIGNAAINVLGDTKLE